jgi:hypothetical protein
MHCVCLVSSTYETWGITLQMRFLSYKRKSTCTKWGYFQCNVKTRCLTNENASNAFACNLYQNHHIFPRVAEDQTKCNSACKRMSHGQISMASLLKLHLIILLLSSLSHLHRRSRPSGIRRLTIIIAHGQTIIPHSSLVIPPGQHLVPIRHIWLRIRVPIRRRLQHLGGRSWSGNGRSVAGGRRCSEAKIVSRGGSLVLDVPEELVASGDGLVGW